MLLVSFSLIISISTNICSIRINNSFIIVGVMGISMSIILSICVLVAIVLVFLCAFVVVSLLVLVWVSVLAYWC